MSGRFTEEELGLLSEREREVRALLMQGLRPDEVTLRLEMSKATVYVHRRNICDKLGEDAFVGVEQDAKLARLVDVVKKIHKAAEVGASAFAGASQHHALLVVRDEAYRALLQLGALPDPQEPRLSDQDAVALLEMAASEEVGA